MINELAAMNRVAGISQTYVDDVFASYVRTGTGASQTITTNIDMTKGYMLWSKGRSGLTDHAVYDSARGVTLDLATNNTAAQTTQATGLTAVSTTGHTIGALEKMNTNAATYVDWVFRKAPKFFDVVTYTGNGANRTIAHGLGIAPGMIAVKRTDVAGSWMVYHNSIANTENLVLNTIAEKVTDATAWNSTTATSSVFSLGTHADINTNAGTYVACLFAHDTSATGLIQCGSFTTDGGGNATVTLGWEPQFLLSKRSDVAENWFILDTARGFDNSSADKRLAANTSAAEVDAQDATPTATGFTFAEAALATYIYLAIRRPNKPPTVGTQVYNAIARTGTGAAATVTGAGFAPDLLLTHVRNIAQFATAFDRLRGNNRQLRTTGTSAEESAATDTVTSFNMDGVSYGADATYLYVNANTDSLINYFFRRAPGVFDEVCYTGTGAAHTEPHNLAAVPELMIIKRRDTLDNWAVYLGPNGPTGYIPLNLTNAFITTSTPWNDTSPTATVFTVGTGSTTNTSASTYVAYLFATLAGISKVGSYTGNGTSQTINCGFATGARFILIKRTDAAGDWYVWDTVRGIIAGNDPHLSLNTTAEEVTTDDSIDPDTSGFIVNQLAATDINVTSATYIFFSVA